ncbi:MAG TPA: peptidylprolyl isomerase [Acidimicrobiaceae bacterium]|nr:peptidylprolyl isomerase [Acidimicrobiaceae bacterium]
MTGDVTLRIETDLGVIDVAVHLDRAPITAAYVLRLVDSGRYDGASFYRSTSLGRPDRRPLIQGGPLAPVLMGWSRESPGIPMLESIDTTDTTGLRHRAGTVSLARDLGRTGHVVPEMFICLDDYPELDAGGRTEPDARGFPAFGTVTAGLDVVAAIAARDTSGATPIERLRGEVLTQPVDILRATSTHSPFESSS